MRMLPSLSHILTGLAAFALLSGVSAADSTRSAGVVMPRPPSFSHSARGSIPHGLAVPGVTLTFIADTDGGVYVFDKAGRMLSALGGFDTPLGLAVDTSDNLYVSDLVTDTISILPPPYTGSRTLLHNLVSPDGIAVDRNGNVAAMNQNGSVSLYVGGATSPRFVSNPAFTYGTSDAFDGRGNLYVSGLNSNHEPLLGIILGGVKGTTISMLATGNALSSVHGIQVTTQGRIAILDRDTIYTYNPPNRKTGSLGEPIATTILGNATTPDDFAFTASNAFVVVSDAGNCTPNGCGVYPSAKLYGYPPGGNPIESVPFSEDQDNGNVSSAAAVSPPEIP